MGFVSISTEAVNPNVGQGVVKQGIRNIFKGSLHQKKQSTTYFYH